MRRAAFALAVLSLLGLIGLGTLLRSAAPPEPDPAEGEPAAPQEHAQPAPLAQPAAGRPARPAETRPGSGVALDALAAAAEDESGAGTLQGTLTWARSFQPVVGAELRLTSRWIHALEPGPEDRPFTRSAKAPVLLRESAKTDERGRFTLERVPQDRTLFLVVLLSGAIVDLKKIERLPAAGQTVDLGELFLAQRGGVRGVLRWPDSGPARIRVVDDPIFDNALLDPAEHARMVQQACELAPALASGGSAKQRDTTLPYPEARLEVDGPFALEGIRPGTAWLIVEVSSCRRLRRQIFVEPGKTTDLGMVVVGRGDGGRAPSTECLLLPPKESGLVDVALVSEDGDRLESMPRPGGRSRYPSISVRVDGIELADVKRVLVRRGKGMPWEVASFKGGPTRAPPHDWLEVTLPATAELTVRVLDPEERPLVPALIRLRAPDAAPGGGAGDALDQALAPRRGEPGCFEARGLPRVRLWLEVRCEGMAAWLRPVELGTRDREVVVVRPEPCFDLRIRTLGPERVPVAKAEVWAAPFAGLREPLLVGKTDARGELLVNGAFRGGLFFAAAHPDFALSPSRAVTGPDLEIEMLPGARVSGVVMERGEKPRSTWMVVATPHATLAGYYGGNPFLEPRLVYTSGEGAFDLRGLLPRAWVVTAAHAKTRRHEIDLSETRHFHQPIELEPDALRASSGRVAIDTQEAGELLVRVTSKSAPDARAVQHAARDGTFAFPGFPEGPCSLALERRERGIAVLLGILELDGPPRDLRLDVRTGSLSLDLRDRDGRAFAGVTVRLEQTAAPGVLGGARLLAVTDARGFALLSGVPIGTYRVLPDGIDPKRPGLKVEVRPGITNVFAWSGPR